jgi:hypothetical protein
MTEEHGFGGFPASRRSVVLAAPFVLGALAIGRGRALAQTRDELERDIGTAAEPSDSAHAFPLAVKRGKRYLVDAAGRPFLIQGDTAWSLIAQLTREDVVLYLDDRRARGFNTLLVNLI